MIANWIIVFLTLVIALFTILIFLVYERIEWLTGAIESHSDMMLRLEAIRVSRVGEPIEIIWWDPSVDSPPLKYDHESKLELGLIYRSVPPKHRKDKPTWKDRFRKLREQIKYGPGY